MNSILDELLQREKWEELVQQSIVLLQQKERPVEAWGYYARAQLEMGNFHAAVGGYEKVVLDSSSTDLQFGYAQSLLGVGQFQKAKEIFHSLLRQDHFHEELYFGLAVIARAEGEPQEGVALLHQIEPLDAEQGLLLGHLYRDQQLHTEALLSYQQALSLNPNNQILQESVQEVLRLHNQSLNKSNRIQESKMRRRLEQTWAGIQELPSDSPSRVHIQQALANKNPSAPPEGYVAELFDEYAERFDAHLVDTLSYQAPKLVAAVINNRYSEQDPASELLDLGVGTGLLADLVSERTKRMIGVDISEKMLKLAEAKGRYQELHCQDIVQFLEESEQEFQLIVATDTLVYFGDLSPFIKGVALRLKASGHCVLTVEKGVGEDYQLHFSGRYRHSFDYIQHLAWEHGLWVSRATQINLRKGGGDWVQGLIMVLEHQ